MIPKIIHYCWIGNPYPDEIKRCIDSWHEQMPDYEFRLWDSETFDMNSLKWVREAFEAKKYAFVSDYIRLYALYNHGGIYLDTDVMVYKSFNDLLGLPYFIGQDFVGAFDTGIIGAEKGTRWIKEVMDYYNDANFVNNDGSMNIKNNPVVFFERLFPRYRFAQIQSAQEFRRDDNIFNLFPAKFFNGRNNIGPVRYPESYSSHLYAGSWTGRPGIKLFKKGIYSSLLNYIYGMNYHFLRKRIVHNFDPIYRQRH